MKNADWVLFLKEVSGLCLPLYIDFILKRDPAWAEELLRLQRSHPLRTLRGQPYHIPPNTSAGAKSSFSPLNAVLFLFFKKENLH